MLSQLHDIGRPAAAKHGLAAGEAGTPQRSDWTIDQGWERYTAEEHAVWKTLFERQTRLLPGRACDEFVAGMRDLPIGPDRIPDFRRMSDVLMKRTGWQVVAVPGLVPDDVFFEHLANRRFPSGHFIRKPHELDYLEEPDVFHDVFGHVPMLMNPAIADYIQAYGVGGLRAHKLGLLDKLARVYWYTVEFGLLRQHDGLRIYGAGIASSRTESVFALDDRSPNRIALRPRARDAHALPDRRFPGDLFRDPRPRPVARTRVDRLRPGVRTRPHAAGPRTRHRARERRRDHPRQRRLPPRQARGCGGMT